MKSSLKNYQGQYIEKLTRGYSLVVDKAIVFAIPVFLGILLVLSGCGAGEYPGASVEPKDRFTINAADLLDKGSYGVLAEDLGKEAVSFRVVRNVAYMNGYMDSSIALLVRNLIQTYPSVDTIVLNNVPGTYDFKATLAAGRLIREACLRTVVPYEAYIASGAVYLFLAGCERIVEQGGRLGIHTWRSYSINAAGEISATVAAKEYPRTDPKHKVYLDYHNEMGISEDFYWRIVATPYDEVHFLTLAELQEYRLMTVERYPWGAPYRLAIESSSTLKWRLARFYVSEGVALLHGNVGLDTARKLRSVLNDYPEVHTLEFGIAPGITASHADYALQLGRVIRELCLTTKIGEHSYVLNEIVHAYIAGCEREFAIGGMLGVASWIDPAKSKYRKISLTQQITEADYLYYYDEMAIDSAFYTYQKSIPRLTPVFLDAATLYEFAVLD